MKCIPVKRLMYHSPNSGEILIGDVEYDGRLTDENILGSVHEVGKTQWIGNNLWFMRDEQFVYRITVETFYQYQKRWYEVFWDKIRRL